MNYAGMNAGCRNAREVCVPEGFDIWCRIEELGCLCGYDPFVQFGLLRDLAEVYSGRPGQDPEDYADEHPVQALACYVRKYLTEYPEAAEALAAAASAPAEEPRPEIAA